MKTAKTKPPKSASASALILAVILTSLLAIIGVMFVMIARVDKMATSAISENKELNSAVEAVVALVSQELVLDVPGMPKGGDYYDYLNGAVNKLTIIVGDVSGKGTAAALYMAKVQGIFRSLYGFGLTPKELFVRANALLWTDLERKSFVTAIGGCFDTTLRRVIIARAGHLPVYTYKRRQARVERLLPRGIGFGLSETDLFSSEIEELTLQYEPGDVFVFVTDGVTEAQRSDREQFGEEKIVPVLEKLADRHAGEILEGILAAVNEFTKGERAHDDQTIVVAKAT